MRKNKINFSIDVLVFISVIGAVFTGVLLRRFPFEAGDRTIWGICRYDWGDLHWVFCLGFMVLVFIHLLLHWHWAKQNFRRYLAIGPKTLVAGTLVITLVFSIVIPVYLTRDLPSRKAFKYPCLKNRPLASGLGTDYTQNGGRYEK